MWPAKPQNSERSPSGEASDSDSVFLQPIEDIVPLTDDGLTREERIELLRNIEASIKDVDQGNFVDFEDILARHRRLL